ncbi:MAG: SGNH/GDSL hydrolase family protein [Verrucomicrobia bacterium]|nr:SGNH/GDSL hydrolase family protein [Verrucomicrobiota bacterium]
MTAIVAFVVALLALELGLRLFGVRPQRFQEPRWLAFHEGAFHDYGIWGQGLIKQRGPFVDQGVAMGEYVPGAIFKVQYDTNPRGYFDSDNAVLMTVNAAGFRGQAQAVESRKAPGTYRILGLGDSFTFGVGVKDSDTFLMGLQQRLNAAPPIGQTFEVLNAGVQGYNTRDEVLYLEQRWLPAGIEPDLVLIVFYLNDAYSDNTFLNMGQTLGVYLNQPEGLAKVSRIWDLAQHKFRARKVTQQTEDYYHNHFFTNAATFLGAPGDFSIDWNDSRAALARARELATENDFQLGVIIFPELHRLDDHYPFEQIHALVGATCRQLGIPVMDLLDTYRGHDPRRLWAHPSDHHPNEKAHAMAAEAIDDFVRREFLSGTGPKPLD